jgi:copper(I)-binding protein
MKSKFFIAACALLASTAFAQNVKVSDAWARSTVQGQKASGAFMTLTSDQPVKLIGVSAAVAGVAQIHEMKMDGNVMKMAPVNALDLPAGQAVALKPGGFHVMLMDLKAPLSKDSQVDLTLTFQDAKGKNFTQTVQAKVGKQAPMASDAAQEHMH